MSIEQALEELTKVEQEQAETLKAVWATGDVGEYCRVLAETDEIRKAAYDKWAALARRNPIRVDDGPTGHGL